MTKQIYLETSICLASPGDNHTNELEAIFGTESPILYSSIRTPEVGDQSPSDSVEWLIYPPQKLHPRSSDVMKGTASTASGSFGGGCNDIVM